MQFGPENLYEQINGRAEYYLAYDVIGMTFASFDKSTDNSIFINLSIYDMGTPTNAFGVFSGERPLEDRDSNLAAMPTAWERTIISFRGSIIFRSLLRTIQMNYDSLVWI